MNKRIRKLLCSLLAFLLYYETIFIPVFANESSSGMIYDIGLNGMSTYYQETSVYANELRYKMNCYGYAIRVYSLVGDSSNPYKQQPGEFSDNNGFIQSKL